MAYGNAAKAYGQNKVLTASPAELTLMLYDGAVKFGNLALAAMEKNDFETTNINIQKCRNIIVELTTTLDHKYKVAEDFENVYNYIFSLLVEANMKKDAGVLGKAVDEIRGMRDTWKEVMKKAKSPQLVLDTK